MSFEYIALDLSFSSSDMKVFVSVIVSLVTFTLYWFVAASPRIKKWFYTKYEADEASLRHIFFSKVFGFFSMGVLAAVTCLILVPEYNLEMYGLGWNGDTAFFSLVWICGLCLLVVPLAFFSAKKEKNWPNYPQIRSKIWTRRTVIMAAVGWFVYLFGYEFLFRGILFFPLVEVIGLWPAIGVNIALYSATHIPKGLDETIGAAPLGLVLCLLTLASGTLWIAILVHVAMAWTNCFTSLKYNPATNYKRK
ncbi:MAG: CPBP family intramembrane metalloprotease [Crocinitomicaceae bacterium]|nr:CPBP family intramembrane metalloprotease [Crocinitomicaceae bacterium]MBK8925410.1 CPBP family intramembrane metalloprotease [Crocinitomicaceae bacterium]